MVGHGPGSGTLTSPPGASESLFGAPGFHRLASRCIDYGCRASAASATIPIRISLMRRLSAWAMRGRGTAVLKASLGRFSWTGNATATDETPASLSSELHE